MLITKIFGVPSLKILTHQIVYESLSNILFVVSSFSGSYIIFTLVKGWSGSKLSAYTILDFLICTSDKKNSKKH